MAGANSTSERSCIDTARLHLRPLNDADTDAVRNLHQDPRMRRYLGDGLPLDSSRSRAWLQRHLDGWARLGFGFFAVELRTSTQFVGWFGLNLIDDHPALNGEVELGGSIAPEHWNSGVAIEAATAVLQHAFRDLGRAHVVARHRDDNEASARLLRRVGMQPWQSVPDLLHPDRTVVVWRSCASDEPGRFSRTSS